VVDDVCPKLHSGLTKARRYYGEDAAPWRRASRELAVPVGWLIRHCERSEAIHCHTRKETGLLRRFAPRNDGLVLQTHLRIPAARNAPGRCIIRSRLKTRAQGKPGARRTRSLACEIKKHTSGIHYRCTGLARPSLRNGIQLTSCSPRRSGLLTPSPREYGGQSPVGMTRLRKT
jgi:hypothetical protein